MSKGIKKSQENFEPSKLQSDLGKKRRNTIYYKKGTKSTTNWQIENLLVY